MGNHGDTCDHCKPHEWHGMECARTNCACPTAWIEPEGECA